MGDTETGELGRDRDRRREGKEEVQDDRSQVPSLP